MTDAALAAAPTLVFVVNDHRQLRSYRVDRIASIKPTTEPFTSTYRVEF